jgi:hypothetical protein
MASVHKLAVGRVFTKFPIQKEFISYIFLFFLLNESGRSTVHPTTTNLFTGAGGIVARLGSLRNFTD